MVQGITLLGVQPTWVSLEAPTKCCLIGNGVTTPVSMVSRARSPNHWWWLEIITFKNHFSEHDRHSVKSFWSRGQSICNINILVILRKIKLVISFERPRVFQEMCALCRSGLPQKVWHTDRQTYTWTDWQQVTFGTPSSKLYWAQMFTSCLTCFADATVTVAGAEEWSTSCKGTNELGCRRMDGVAVVTTTLWTTSGSDAADDEDWTDANELSVDSAKT